MQGIKDKNLNANYALASPGEKSEENFTCYFVTSCQAQRNGQAVTLLLQGLSQSEVVMHLGVYM